MAFTAQGVLAAELIGPLAGKGLVAVVGLPWGEDELSVLTGADPAAIAGDVIEWDIATSPSGFDVAMNADGTFTVGPDDDGTEQTFDYRLWRYLTGDWTAEATVTLEGDASRPTISGGGFLLGLGFEPFPSGETGLWNYTEQGVLANEPRLFGGISTVTGNGTLAGLGEAPFLGWGTGSLTGNGTLTGLGETPLPPITQGFGTISAGGSILGSGDTPAPFSWEVQEVDGDLWIKISPKQTT